MRTVNKEGHANASSPDVSCLYAALKSETFSLFNLQGHTRAHWKKFIFFYAQNPRRGAASGGFRIGIDSLPGGGRPEIARAIPGGLRAILRKFRNLTDAGLLPEVSPFRSLCDMFSRYVAIDAHKKNPGRMFQWSCFGSSRRLCAIAELFPSKRIRSACAAARGAFHGG